MTRLRDRPASADDVETEFCSKTAGCKLAGDCRRNQANYSGPDPHVKIWKRWPRGTLGCTGYSPTGRQDF